MKPEYVLRKHLPTVLILCLAFTGCSDGNTSASSRKLKESDQIAIDVAIWLYANESTLTGCKLEPGTSLYKRMDKYFNKDSHIAPSFGQLHLVAQGSGLPSGYLIQVSPGDKVKYTGKLNAEVEFIEGQIGLTQVFKNEAAGVSHDFQTFVADGSKCKVNGVLLVYDKGGWKKPDTK